MQITREVLWEFLADLPHLQRRIYFILAVILAVCFRKKNIKSCLKYYLIWFITGYIIFYLAYSITANMYFGSDTYIMISASLIYDQLVWSFPLVADSVFLMFIFQKIYQHPSKITLLFYILSVILLFIYEIFTGLDIVSYIIIKLLAPIFNLLPDTVIRF